MKTATMPAAILHALPSRRLELQMVARPEPELDDVVLRVDACGICGTDLHIMAGESYRPELPFVLGHEPVGTVVSAGANATHWLGRRVTITLFTGCGHCAFCLQGDERLCPDVVSDTGVFGAWGAYAGFVRVHAAQLLEVPDSLGSPEAASLVDAGATAANSVRVAGERDPDRVLVIGAGPIGLLCAELLADRGVALQVVQRSPARREVVAAMGHHTLATIEEAGGLFDVVIDCTGYAAAFSPGIAKLGPRGFYILAGYARVPEVDFAAVARKEISIRGIRSGHRRDLAEVLDLTAAGRVRLPEITTWPLSQINEAFEALRDSRVAGKAVIVPDPELEE